MTATHHTHSIIEHVRHLGWYFTVDGLHTTSRRPVALLDPDRTEAQLRQQYGMIRELTEIITLEGAVVDPATIKRKVRTIGWHFESYNPNTDTWEPVTELDATLTEATLRDREETIRQLTPVGLLSEVAAATYAPADDEEPTTARPERTESDR